MGKVGDQMQELNIVANNQFLYENLSIGYQLFENEKVVSVLPETDMYDLLIMLECFSSKSEARKNWTRIGKEIPPGYNEFKNIGKQKKALYIWNPVKVGD